MFVPQARIKLGHSRPAWLGSRKKTRGPRQTLTWFEFFKMPCLIPNLIGSILGTIILCGGGFMCFIGYSPGHFFNKTEFVDVFNSSALNSTNVTSVTHTVKSQTTLKILAYIGPVLMGLGFFVVMVAVVLFCEIRDKFIKKILPKRDIDSTKKADIYDMVIDEFRKNYFRGIEVPIKTKSKSISLQMPTLYKALSVSTPAILITPEVQRKWHRDIKLTPKQKRKRRLSEHETWLKTSSMPNIRPKSIARIQRRLSRISKIYGDKDGLSRTHNNNEQNGSQASKNDSDTCFSNPAFRGSPTETIELSEILTEFPKHPNNIEQQQRPADVIVHIDGPEVADDNRGITERRNNSEYNENNKKHTGLNGGSSLCAILKTPVPCKRSRSPLVSSKFPFRNNPKVIVTDAPDSDDDLSPFDVAPRNRLRLNSYDHVDFAKRGPHVTRIGIFRSETSLHKIRSIVNKPLMDNDDSSLDSLTLNEETIKYFEYH